MTRVSYERDRPAVAMHRIAEMKLRAGLLLEALGWLERDDYVDSGYAGLVLARAERVCRQVAREVTVNETKMARTS